jgi:hypothetical protein
MRSSFRSLIVVGVVLFSSTVLAASFCGQVIDEKTTTILCTDSSLVDLSPLAAAPNLERLDLRHTRVIDLGPLAQLTNLNRLQLGSTPVHDLKPLAKLPLVDLGLTCTQVADLSPLKDMKTLRELDLSMTKVRSVRPLMDLPALDQVDLRDGTPVPEAEARELGRHARHVYWGKNGEGHFGKNIR